MTFTGIQNVETSSCPDRDFPVDIRNELKTGTPVASLAAPGVRGSALGLVGPMSVYCNWVR